MLLLKLLDPAGSLYVIILLPHPARNIPQRMCPALSYKTFFSFGIKLCSVYKLEENVFSPENHRQMCSTMGDSEGRRIFFWLEGLGNAHIFRRKIGALSRSRVWPRQCTVVVSQTCLPRTRIPPQISFHPQKEYPTFQYIFLHLCKTFSNVPCSCALRNGTVSRRT